MAYGWIALIGACALGALFMSLQVFRRLARWHLPQPIQSEWDDCLASKGAIRSARTRGPGQSKTGRANSDPTFKRGEPMPVRRWKGVRRK